MKERLIELMKQDPCPDPMLCNNKCKYVHLENCFAERYADYLIANGVIVPPCKFGQTVYRIVTMGTGVTFKKVGFNTYREKKQTIKHFIRCVTVTKNNFFDVIENWGKTAFLTREEAEAMLKERKEDEGK